MIARAFVKANSVLPSSAAAKRLFGVVDMILPTEDAKCLTNYLTKWCSWNVAPHANHYSELQRMCLAGQCIRHAVNGLVFA